MFLKFLTPRSHFLSFQNIVFYFWNFDAFMDENMILPLVYSFFFSFLSILNSGMKWSISNRFLDGKSV